MKTDRRTPALSPSYVAAQMALVFNGRSLVATPRRSLLTLPMLKRRPHQTLVLAPSSGEVLLPVILQVAIGTWVVWYDEWWL